MLLSPRTPRTGSRTVVSKCHVIRLHRQNNAADWTMVLPFTARDLSVVVAGVAAERQGSPGPRDGAETPPKNECARAPVQPLVRRPAVEDRQPIRLGRCILHYVRDHVGCRRPVVEVRSRARALLRPHFPWEADVT